MWFTVAVAVLFGVLQSENPLLTHADIVDCIETVHHKMQEEQEREFTSHHTQASSTTMVF